jgi:ribulose-phosphate 3-epimerase
VHDEVVDDIAAIARLIRAQGARASVAINPDSGVERVLAAAEHLDMILVMSVHPGFGGQELIPATLDKLRRIRRELDRRGLDIDLEVDGGIKLENIAEVKAAGANVFVSGSGIFGHEDYAKVIASMRRNLARA